MAEGRSDDSRSPGATSPSAEAGADGTPGGAVDALLARVARGDADALSAVYDQVADPVYGLVRRIV